MKIQFIGHGLKGNTGTVGDYLCSSLKDENFNSFHAFSAFTKMSGINIFQKELIEAKNFGKELKFYLGIVEKGTSKEVLDFLIDNTIETWIFCTSSNIIFHPKIYIFKGEKKTRFIIGSSNLTKQGLFDNIEASTLIEFYITDNQGQKFERQFYDYFSSIINGSDKNVERLDQNVLDDLIKSGFVTEDRYTNDDKTLTKQHKILFKQRTKKVYNKDEIGNIKTNIDNKRNSIYTEEITDFYLEHWDELFQKFIEYTKRENRKTVARNYSNRKLYTWYRRQKVYYKRGIIPKVHLAKLNEIGFIFDSSYDHKTKVLDEEMLEVLLDALIEGEEVRANHRYIYNGIKLGSWLVHVNESNKRGRRFDTRKEITDLGFYYKNYSRESEHVVERFLRDLVNETNPDKQKFRNKFNSQIHPKQNEIKLEIKQEIEVAWKNQFNEKLNWKIIPRSRDYTSEW